MNKIEAGCLAIVINSEAGNDGRFVTAIDYIGHVRGYVGKFRWSIAGTLPDTEGDPISHMQESQLMRIDGTPPEELELDKVKELIYEAMMRIESE